MQMRLIKTKCEVKPMNKLIDYGFKLIVVGFIIFIVSIILGILFAISQVI